MLFPFRCKLTSSHFMVTLIITLFLTACGGGDSKSNTTKEAAFEKIIAYAQNTNSPAPTLQDYIDAGVVGLSNEDLPALNQLVKNLDEEDVDTITELDILTTQLNINILPTADAGADKVVQIGQTVVITGSGSDIDGTIASYQWKKGNTPLATTASFTYAPTAVGTDTLTLTVTDNDGDTANDSMVVTVTEISNLPPTADAGNDRTVLVNKKITITGSGSDSDGTISSFQWKKGDTVLSTNASFDYTPTSVGTDTLTLTVTDNKGATASDSTAITVTADPIPPVAIAGDDVKAILEQAITITGNGTDADGTVESFEWKKDGVVLSTDASFDYTPTGKGTDTLTLKVTDDDGQTATDEMNVLVGIEIPDSNRFLTFVNTGEPDANEINVENEFIANTYYSTIDPDQKRDTLEEWYIENCFKEAPVGYVDPPDCDDDIGNHAFAIYLNNVDLNLGRRMALRSNSDQVMGNPVGFLRNTVASCVENYGSIDDAISQTNSIATVCMEYSPSPTDINGKKFTKFYTYGPTGERITKVDLDGRGEKYQPDMCLTCHGGNPGTVEGALYSNGGDTQAGFIPWDLNNFKFHSSNGTFSKEAQEGEFKKLNQAALRTYEVFDSAGPEQAKATREMIRGWYNFTGDTIPQSSTFDGGFTPPDWQDHESLYHDVVVPSCRACHIQRGLMTSGAIDFSKSSDFLAYKNTIKTLVFEEGTMPLAKRTYDLFWDNLREGNQAEKLWAALGFMDEVSIPGAPIPKIAPITLPEDFAIQRMVPIDGRKSLFSEEFNWEVVQSPQGASFTLNDSESPIATLELLNNTSFGNYKFKLTTKNEDEDEEFTESSVVNIDVTLTFTGNVFPILQGDCFACHASVNNSAAFSAFPMSQNENTTYNEVITRVNLGTPPNSLLLQKATTNGVSHSGGQRFTVGSTEYNTILKWIQQGALNN